jgi:hypothetical protein
MAAIFNIGAKVGILGRRKLENIRTQALLLLLSAPAEGVKKSLGG